MSLTIAYFNKIQKDVSVRGPSSFSETGNTNTAYIVV